MQFPQPVADYLLTHAVEATRPACLKIDPGYRLLQGWGALAHFGLDAISPGDDVLAAAPFTFAMLEEKIRAIEFVTLQNRHVAHIHYLPDETGHFVLVLDAAREHAARQRYQQSVNEMRLMHVSQTRLIARQRDLIGELVEARAELDHQRHVAERNVDTRSQLIALMSHEFQTPIESIANAAESALHADSEPADRARSLDAIRRSARFLTTLIQAVLDDARLEAGQLSLQPTVFDVHALLDDLVQMMAPLAAEKALAFVCQVADDLPREARLDQVRLRQILINVVGNAVKFTREGGVQLMAAHRDGRLTFSVADTGPGISPADQQRVFEAFERASGSDAPGGAGLGLTISLRLAKLMGGSITLESEPGQGTTVRVALPDGLTPET